MLSGVLLAALVTCSGAQGLRGSGRPVDGTAFDECREPVPVARSVVTSTDIPSTRDWTMSPTAFSRHELRASRWLPRHSAGDSTLPIRWRHRRTPVRTDLRMAVTAVPTGLPGWGNGTQGIDGAVRDILFNDPGPAPIDSWMGQSVGKWEGDTLVVTVTGQNDSTWFDRAGNFHSGDMKVVERWTLMNENTIHYEAEITDPATFTKPWKMSMLIYRRLGDDARLQQFKCVEFVEELMYGDLRKEPLK